MENRLLHALRSLRKEGKFESIMERLVQLLGSIGSRDAFASEYAFGRSEGLTISETELSLYVYEGIRRLGVDSFLSILEKSESPKQPVKIKRKRRKTKDDKDRKKKPKPEILFNF